MELKKPPPVRRLRPGTVLTPKPSNGFVSAGRGARAPVLLHHCPFGSGATGEA